MATSTGQRSYEYCKFEVVSLNSYIYSYFDGWPGGMSCVGYEDTKKRHGRLLKRSTICLQSHTLHNIYNMYCFVTIHITFAYTYFSGFLCVSAELEGLRL